MRSLKSLRFVILAVVLIALVVPAYAQEATSQVVVPKGEKIKIAVVTDLTGPIAPMGLDIWQASQIAAEDINAAGGIQGFEVELTVDDDGCSGDQATLVANRIVSDPQVVAVAGHSCSGATIAASEIYEDYQIVVMSPSATAEAVTARGLTVMNRVAPIDAIQGLVDANYMYKVLGFTKIAVFHDNDAYGLGLATTVKETFEELGGEVVAFEGISVDDTDYRFVLTPLVAEAPEAVFFGGYQEQAVLLVTQMREVGLEDTVFYGPDGIFAQAYIDGAGEDAEGTYASFALFDTGSAEANEVFDAKYKEKFGKLPHEQGPFHAQAYDSVMILAAAIDSVAEVDADGNLVIDRAALIEAVRATTDFDGLTGTLTCSETGECGNTQIGINLVEDGAWVEVEIPEDLLAE